MAAFTAAGTSYATHGEPMIPIYVFYSMFGFQRTGDSIWAAADQMTRGFLIGATAGRTTLTGEGLQHADGHSPLLAATNPAVVSYDPAFAFEIAHIMQDGLRRMYGDDPENVIYYITVYNEPMSQPAEPENVDREGILRGMHLFAPGNTEGLGDERAARAAARLRRRRAVGARGPGAAAQRLGRRGRRVVGDLVERAASRRPGLRRAARSSTPTRSAACPTSPQRLRDTRARSWRSRTTCARCRTRSSSGCPADFASLGADGFGFSDTRPAARRFFHIDGPSVAVRALQMLAERGEVDGDVAREAASRYRLLDVTAGTSGNAGGES